MVSKRRTWRKRSKRGRETIHISSGGLDPRQTIPVGPNYQVPLARQGKQAVSMPVVAAGLITEPEQVEAIMGTGDADTVALARAPSTTPAGPLPRERRSPPHPQY